MPKDLKIEMKTLSDCINKLREEGFPEDFSVKEKGLNLLNSQKYYMPTQVKILNFYRFEGDSDPSDNAILYGIETDDGVKGVLSDAYGAYADRKTTEFIKQVEEITKQRGNQPEQQENPIQE